MKFEILYDYSNSFNLCNVAKLSWAELLEAWLVLTIG